MKVKKTLKSVLRNVLTIGASTALGLLSFSGMYAIIPLIQIAFSSTVLSVSYEYEIYSQNINSGLRKLFNAFFLKKRLADNFLAKILEKLHAKETDLNTFHPFFKEYSQKYLKVRELEDKHFNKEGQKRLKVMQKEVLHMEKAFALEVFNENNLEAPLINYDENLNTWIADNLPEELQEFTKEKADLNKLNRKFTFFKILSSISAIFMGIGMTYLLAEAISILPFIVFLPQVTLPILIIFMSAAFGLLTFNALTDLYLNNPFKEQWEKIKQGKLTAGKVFIIVAGIFLSALAIVLTICTAGTWLTIVRESRPLFNWVSKLPRFIMGIINPIIIGLSAVVFNLQNTAESLEIISEAVNSENSFLNSLKDAVKSHFSSLEQENIWQKINPARWLLKLTLTPLRVILFLGHLISIGVTSDRVEGVNELISAFFGIISEGFEDFHYFVPHADAINSKTLTAAQKQEIFKEHLISGQGHNHNEDFPTKLLKAIFTPIYLLSAFIDWQASKLNKGTERPTLNFKEALYKQYGVHEENFPQIQEKSSYSWIKSNLLYSLEHFKQKHAHQDKEALTNLQKNIRNCPKKDFIPQLTEARIFFREKQTAEFFTKLPSKIDLMPN